MKNLPILNTNYIKHTKTCWEKRKSLLKNLMMCGCGNGACPQYLHQEAEVDVLTQFWGQPVLESEIQTSQGYLVAWGPWVRKRNPTNKMNMMISVTRACFKRNKSQTFLLIFITVAIGQDTWTLWCWWWESTIVQPLWHTRWWLQYNPATLLDTFANRPENMSPQKPAHQFSWIITPHTKVKNTMPIAIN